VQAAPTRGFENPSFAASSTDHLSSAWRTAREREGEGHRKTMGGWFGGMGVWRRRKKVGRGGPNDALISGRETTRNASSLVLFAHFMISENTKNETDQYRAVHN
jgi:hypothetical protein